MGSVYKHGRVYWIKYYAQGRPIRENTRTDNHEAARTILKEREGRVGRGEPVLLRVDTVTYDQARDDLQQHYATTGERVPKEANRRLAHLDPFFGGRRLNTITGADVTAYVAMRQATGAANGTINRELGVLSKLLRVAFRNNKLLRRPALSFLKEAAPRQGFFEQEQFEAVRRRLPDDLRVVVTIAHTYGWRVPSEVLTLDRRQLDLDAGTLRLDPGTTKNDDGRMVYLTPELKVLLAAQVARVEGLQRRRGTVIPALFPHLTGAHAGRRIRNFCKAWTTACKAAGVAGRTRHDLRRTAVRNLERRGVPRSWAMKMTGHRTENVYRRYAIVSDADLQEATRRLVGTNPGTIEGVGSGAARETRSQSGS